MTLGNRIRAAREKAGLSLEAVAEACGVSAGTVSRWETGHVDIPWSRLVMVSKAVGVSVGSLVAPRTSK